jgi:hypothetical protein
MTEAHHVSFFVWLHNDTVWATSEASVFWCNHRGHLSLIQPLVEEMSVSTNNSNKDTHLNG